MNTGRMIALSLSLTYGLAFAAGCSQPEDAGGMSEMERMAAAMDRQSAPQADEQGASESQEPDPAPQPQTAQPRRRPANVQGAAGVATGEELQTFTPNSPRRGQAMAAGGSGGYLTTVLSTRFWAEHRIIELNMKNTLRQYNAQHGRYPETHEEFMEQIANPIGGLPVLPEGQEYVYDPEDPMNLKVRVPSDGAPAEQ